MWSLIKFKNCQKVIFPTKMLRPSVNKKVNVAGTDVACAVMRESGIETLHCFNKSDQLFSMIFSDDITELRKGKSGTENPEIIRPLSVMVYRNNYCKYLLKHF